MTPDIANTTEELKQILAKISFQKSCVDFQWNWDVEELICLKHVPAGYPDPETVPQPRLARVEYLKGWLVNTNFRRPDINTGKVGIGKGRQIFIATGSTKDAVFFTCWVLVDLIVKHEMMEAIRFEDKRVLNPHHTLDELSIPDILKSWPGGPISIDDLKEALRNEHGDSC